MQHAVQLACYSRWPCLPTLLTHCVNVSHMHSVKHTYLWHFWVGHKLFKVTLNSTNLTKWLMLFSSFEETLYAAHLVLSLNTDLHSILPQAELGKLGRKLRHVTVTSSVQPVRLHVKSSLAYPPLARLRESAEKRVWQQRRGLVVTHCHHSILCRRSPEAPVTNQRHYWDATLNKICLPYITFQSHSCVNIILV